MGSVIARQSRLPYLPPACSSLLCVSVCWSPPLLLQGSQVTGRRDWGCSVLSSLPMTRAGHPMALTELACLQTSVRLLVAQLAELVPMGLECAASLASGAGGPPPPTTPT